MPSRRKPRATICSFQELRPLHVKLLQQWPTLDGAARLRRGEAFRQKAAAVGAWIKNLEERDGAQGLIDYWTATMAGLPEFDTYPQFVTLAPFDPATVRSLRRRSPFVGLNPFRIEDWQCFHGRAKATGDLVAALGDAPLLVVSGPSGLGKSSLVQAGLASKLHDDPRWSILPILTPGRDPVAALLRAVRPDEAEEGWLDEQRRAIAKTPELYRTLLEEELAERPAGLLVVDRAEELFTSDVAAAEISAMVAVLAALVKPPAGGADHRVVLAIRDDFLDQLRAALKAAGHELPDTAILVPDPVTAEEMEEAIVRPGEASGLRFEPAVVEDLVRDCLGQSDALPMLEFALTRLRDEAEVDRIGWGNYQRVGKPSELIQTTAEEALAALPASVGPESARRVFLELTGAGPCPALRRLRRDELRQQVKSDEVDGALLDQVLERFVDARLLRRIGADARGDDRFEIAHEAVIRRWPRLLVWLQDRRREDMGRERLLAAFERWRAGGRRGRHLLAGQALKDAFAYKGMSRPVDEFIAASRRGLYIRWTALAAVPLVVALLSGYSVNDAWNDLRSVSSVYESRTAETSEVSGDFARQAMVADQALLSLVTRGALTGESVPDVFAERMGRAPRKLQGEPRGYDPDFLAGADEDPAPLRVPLPTLRSSDLRILRYPHLTVLYDPRRRVPLVAASNYDRDASPLPPFEGIGFFADPRLPASEQSGERVSPDRNFGRVPLSSFQEVSWSREGDLQTDTSFLNYAPISVVQPWRFYLGAWARIETKTLAKASRVILLTGPVLRSNDPRVGDSIVPRSFWKIAVYRDEATGARTTEAYLLDVGAAAGAGGTQSLTTVANIAGLTKLDFGDLRERAAAKAGESPAAPTAATPASPPSQGPTVYLQFAVMPRHNAVEISQALAERGYVIPGEERIGSARGLLEVRYGHNSDAGPAEALARATEETLAKLGYGDVEVKVERLRGTPPPRGVLELWIGRAPPANTPD